MIKSSLWLAAGSLLTQLSFAQQVQQQEAKLESVTVFSHAAELKHHAEVNLPHGSSEIVFTHVAGRIDENSIQVGSSPDVTILSVRPTSNYAPADVKTAIYQEAEDHYKAALQTLKQLENEKATEESTLKLLEQNQRISGENGTTSSALSQMLAFYKPKYLETKNNISSLEERIKTQQGLVDKAKIHFDEVAGQNSASAGQLIVQVINNSTGNKPFNITYLTQQANWNASYELRAENLKSPLQIIYKANVSQQTGIDWQQVKLQLSSANPTQSGSAPTLSPWHLHYNQGNTLNEVTVRRSAGAATLMAAAPAPQTLHDAVEQTEHQLNTSFDIAIPYNIASNGKAHAVQLKAHSQTAKYHYYLAPGLQTEAFLMAELTDFEKLNLVPGQANVLFENMYVGKTMIQPNTASDTLKISLGRDKMIAVKREKINDLSSSKFIGNSKTETLVYETTIKNNKRVPIELTVQERYPLSTDKDMEIKLESYSNGQVDKERGIVTWQLNIPAGGSQKLQFGYSVKHPKDKTVNL